jgi:hypothetical protein
LNLSIILEATLQRFLKQSLWLLLYITLHNEFFSVLSFVNNTSMVPFIILVISFVRLSHIVILTFFSLQCEFLRVGSGLLSISFKNILFYCIPFNSIKCHSILTYPVLSYASLAYPILNILCSVLLFHSIIFWTFNMRSVLRKILMSSILLLIPVLQIVPHSVVVLKSVKIVQISRVYLSCLTQIYAGWWVTPDFLLSPTPNNHLSNYCHDGSYCHFASRIRASYIFPSVFAHHEKSSSFTSESWFYLFVLVWPFFFQDFQYISPFFLVLFQLRNLLLLS